MTAITDVKWDEKMYLSNFTTSQKKVLCSPAKLITNKHARRGEWHPIKCIIVHIAYILLLFMVATEKSVPIKLEYKTTNSSLTLLILNNQSQRYLLVYKAYIVTKQY